VLLEDERLVYSYLADFVADALEEIGVRGGRPLTARRLALKNALRRRTPAPLPERAPEQDPAAVESPALSPGSPDKQPATAATATEPGHGPATLVGVGGQDPSPQPA